MHTAATQPDFNWQAPEIEALVRAALDEDMGKGRAPRTVDLTAKAIVAADDVATGRIVARQGLVLAGAPLAELAFRLLDPAVRFQPQFPEGASVPADETVARIEGRARAILSAERTALNFLAHLSGIATLTRRFVEAIAGTQARIRDTRKTTPMHRVLEKYAVRVGGGSNHRFGLFDGVLIKENHIALAGRVREAVRRVRANSEPGAAANAGKFRTPWGEEVPVQVEVRNEAELREALAAGADSVLLDNVTPPAAKQLIGIARRERPGCTVEVSGGVKLDNVRAYAEAGADFIAIGALTHSAPAADFSLLVEPLAVR